MMYSKEMGIKEKIINLCAGIFRNSGVDMDMIEYIDFTEDIEMDSIAFITLIVELETTFNITIPDDLLLIEYFKNVDDIVRVIRDQMVEESTKKGGDR